KASSKDEAFFVQANVDLCSGWRSLAAHRSSVEWRIRGSGVPRSSKAGSPPTIFKASSKDEAFFVQANVDLCSGWRSLAAHRSSVEWRIRGAGVPRSSKAGSSPTIFKASSKDEAFFVQANVDLCSGWRSLAAHRSSVEWRIRGSGVPRSSKAGSPPTIFKASSKDEAFFVQANVDLCSGWRSLAAHRSSVEWRIRGSGVHRSSKAGSSPTTFKASSKDEAFFVQAIEHL
ncbi:hypothetical protein, partial [Photobacterium swingsii]|uniref:hypothetical protein n=1 Tax=Photobacterium swingsii TaxID=680026 RepID=UPI004068E028